jgi:hypothetical protein
MTTTNSIPKFDHATHAEKLQRSISTFWTDLASYENALYEYSLQLMTEWRKMVWKA